MPHECGNLRLCDDGTLELVIRGGDGEDIRTRRLGRMDEMDRADLPFEMGPDFLFLQDVYRDAQRDSGEAAAMRRDFNRTRGAA